MCLFHVVCHDCPFEHIIENEEGRARNLADTHELNERHDVEYGRVA